MAILMSLNDPQWGRKGGGRDPQGPPDLEELWSDFNKKLNGLLNGRNKGAPPGGDGKDPLHIEPRKLGGGIGILLALGLAAWLGSGFYIVDASQRGVVLQFGKFKEVTEPGLRWRLPSPFESNELVNLTGVRTIEVGYRGSEKNKVLKEALMLTDDENIINIQFAVQYVLKEPVDYVFKNRHPDDAVMQAAETAMREVVGRSKMDYVLYEGREQVGALASKLMQDILDRYETGVLISKLTLQNAQPPEQVQAAFDDAVKAGQDKERQKNEGQAYANDVIPKARGTAARLQEEAMGYRERIIATSEGDASRFRQINSEYVKAPEVTRQRMYLETLQQIYSSTSKVMIDSKGQGNLLYLPLDKLLAASASVAVSSGTGNEVAPAQMVGKAASSVSNEVPPQVEKAPAVEKGGYSAGVSRDRESLRNRDREGR